MREISNESAALGLNKRERRSNLGITLFCEISESEQEAKLELNEQNFFFFFLEGII